jgi:hypothetical protein
MNRDKEIRAGVLLSGGLDSLLVVKMMQEQGVDIFALYFKLPFSSNFENELKEFSHKHKFNLKVLDCTKGKLLEEYFEMIKRAKHGRGAGFNPCIDCRIFLFKKAKEFAEEKKLNFIVTGEVLDERPMSQKQKTMKLIDEEAGLKNMVLRPLSAKLLEETIAEKNKLVNRDVFFDIHGKRRIRQMEMAKKLDILYPSPAGGCLLCEKQLRKRFKFFFAEKELWNYFYLLAIGRHFFMDGNWIILGRNERENEILEKVKGGFLITPDYTGPSVLAFGKIDNSLKKELDKMIKSYSKKGSLGERKIFEQYKI